MFIPPQGLQNNPEPAVDQSNLVLLKASHLLIGHELVRKVFGNIQNVYVEYLSDVQTFLIVSVANQSFKKNHKPSQMMLKSRNLKGDKSLAIHEWLIDHQLNSSDRELTFELNPGDNMLMVKL
jgi:hypothetical protein